MEKNRVIFELHESLSPEDFLRWWKYEGQDSLRRDLRMRGLELDKSSAEKVLKTANGNPLIKLQVTKNPVYRPPQPPGGSFGGDSDGPADGENE